jgi:hypothetical protein
MTVVTEPGVLPRAQVGVGTSPSHTVICSALFYDHTQASPSTPLTHS